MTADIVRIWHCDGSACDASVPEKTDGWADEIYTHGCPKHRDLISEHRMKLDHTTRGRGNSEKTTWYVSCACGWRPTPSYATYNYRSLQDRHRAHVRGLGVS